MKIGILRANAIGDLVVALPALRAIRNHFPDAHITLVARPMHQELAHLIPVDEVVVEQNLIDRHLDLGIQMHGGGAQSNPIVTSWHAKESVGFQAPGAPPLDRNLPYTYFQHEVLRFLELAAFIGATDLDPSVQITPAGLRNGPVVIHPGASDHRRRWSPSKFVQVIDALERECVLIGDQSETGLCSAIADATGARDLCDRLTLPELVDLIHEAPLVIANDSGPRHLAEALGTPTIGIYWIGNLINAGPLFRHWHRAHISWRLDCPVCQTPAVLDDGTGMPRCPHNDSFVADVPVEGVIDDARDLMK